MRTLKRRHAGDIRPIHSFTPDVRLIHTRFAPDFLQPCSQLIAPDSSLIYIGLHLVYI
jgi:hypothetical protein